MTKSTNERRQNVEDEIVAILRDEHHDLFWMPTNAEWRERTGQTETMRDSDRSYIYSLAEYIVGGRKSSPSNAAYRVKTNGATGRERLAIIQKVARGVKRTYMEAATR